MNKLKTRLSIVLIGFLVLLIPLLIFNYSLDKLYYSTKDNLQENITENLLNTAKELQKNTEPYAYLNLYFNKLHKELFPEAPNTVKKIPDQEFVNNLYNENVFQQLIASTTKKFNPIMITMAGNGLKSTYNYYSPILIKHTKTDKEREILLRAKKHYDIESLSDDYFGIFNVAYDTSEIIAKVNKAEFRDYCFKYLSRYNEFKYFMDGSYTDYFDKQIIYNVIKSTMSPKGIHGYYSLLITQNRINPDEIIATAIEESNQSNIKIEIIEDTSLSKLQENKDGFEYFVKFPTSFLKHTKTYNNINNIKDNYYQNKQYRLSAQYPDSLNQQKFYNDVIKILSAISLLFYVIISVLLFIKAHIFKASLQKKLLTILSIVVFMPIFGVALTVWLSIQNIDKIITNNISQNLHNELEKMYFRNQENNKRMLSAIHEMKRRISKNHIKEQTNSLYEYLLEETVFPSHIGNSWYTMWLNDLVIYTEDGELMVFDDEGVRKKDNKSKNKLENEGTEELGYLVNKYMENLGLIKKKQPAPGTKEYSKYIKYETRKTYALAFMDKYLLPEIEAFSAGQEGIPEKDLQSFTDSALSVYYYAKDLDGKRYYINHKRSGQKERPYDYMEAFIRNGNHFWFMPNHRFSSISLVTGLNNRRVQKNRQWPSNKSSSNEINKLLVEAKELKDSTSFKQQKGKETTIKEFIYRGKDPFIVGGIAKSDKDNTIEFYLYSILGSLICYTIILLTVITKFISVFIEKPVMIYNKAINRLANKEYGLTIDSFSKDEFDSITNAFNEMSIALKQKEQIKRYVSDRLIQSVQENAIPEAGNGKAEKLTILSSDIRNFTGTSECHTPAEIVEMLNSYFTLMQQAISAQHGIIDKYIGDAIQAVFYDEPGKEHHILRACRAALSMRKSLSELNSAREKSGLFTIENGIGIDTDIAITGTIGTPNGRKDYTVYGEVIDRAAALEAKTKGTRSKILLSSNSAKEISDFINGNVFDEESVELIDVKQ